MIIAIINFDWIVITYDNELKYMLFSSLRVSVSVSSLIKIPLIIDSFYCKAGTDIRVPSKQHGCTNQVANQ
jgi:hypothetical protein